MSQYHWQGGRLAHILGLEMMETLPSPIYYTRLAPTLRRLQGLPDMPLQLWVPPSEYRRGRPEPGGLDRTTSRGLRDVSRRRALQHYTTFGACPPGQESMGPPSP